MAARIVRRLRSTVATAPLPGQPRIVRLDDGVLENLQSNFREYQETGPPTTKSMKQLVRAELTQKRREYLLEVEAKRRAQLAALAEREREREAQREENRRLREETKARTRRMVELREQRRLEDAAVAQAQRTEQAQARARYEHTHKRLMLENLTFKGRSFVTRERIDAYVQKMLESTVSYNVGLPIQEVYPDELNTGLDDSTSAMDDPFPLWQQYHPPDLSAFTFYQQYDADPADSERE